MDARAVVFDFDGVLADTEGLHLRAFKSALDPLGFTLSRDDYYERFIGYNDHDLVRALSADQGRVLKASDYDEIIAAKSREYWRLLNTGDVLCDGAAACVARLGARYRLAIASGAMHEEIDAILAANRLSSAIAVIVGADDVKKGKPSPEPYATAVAALGVKPSRAVAIEDTPMGLWSAESAGLRRIGITTSLTAAHLREDADAIVDHLDEVTIELVDGLIGLE
jgi:beta-phosphoglucomutase-like phosphatase (HAD superfamily)